MKKTNLRIASGHPAKSKFLAIIIVSLLSLIAVGEAQADDADPTLGLSVDLVDGSHIIGIPSTKAVPVDTPYGKMDIPLNLIRRIKIGDDHETVSVYPINGDKITGVLGHREIRLKTIFGKISVGTEHIKNITISGTGRLPVIVKESFPVVASAKITDKPYGMFCVADFNGDKHLDFAVSDKTKGSGSVDVYLNDGKGSLIKKASYPVGHFPQHIVAGDFNEDGDVDLIVPVYLGALGDGTMRVLTGNGDGTFTMGPGFTAKVNGKGLHPNRMAVGDLNKDGHLDFVVEMGNDWAINIHWGKGDGTFTPMYTYPNGQNPGNTKIADLNNDGWPDIVSGSQYTSLFVHLSNFGDAYKAPVQYLKGTSRRQPIIVGDLDGDEDIDVLCARQTSPRYVSVMINDGHGVFTEKGKIDFPDGTGLAKVTDFDFDGKMDFVLGSGNNVLVVPGNGDGTFKKPVAYDMGHKVGGLQLHDLNHDGRLDLVYIDGDSHKVMMRLNATLPSPGIPEGAALRKPPGEFQVDYAGLRWDLMRTGWEVQDGKLASQRHVRPGFQYGHWAHGRGGLAITGNGDESWGDYEVAFDFKMLPANRKFFHAHIPGDSRGMSVIFRANSASESWNQPATNCGFGLSPSGGWSLGAVEDSFMTGRGYNSNNRRGKHEKLASGKSESYKDASEGRLRLRVQGNTITVWLNDEQLVEHTHDGQGIDLSPSGGFGIQWKWEAMGWISNLEVQKL